VILRLPIVYGPWGKPGSFDYDLSQTAIRHWHDKGTVERELGSQSILLMLTGLSEHSQVEYDLLFVDGKKSMC
jgi:nucleoside-diphosphate-sugar epimerase